MRTEFKILFVLTVIFFEKGYALKCYHCYRGHPAKSINTLCPDPLHASGYSRNCLSDQVCIQYTQQNQGAGSTEYMDCADKYMCDRLNPGVEQSIISCKTCTTDLCNGAISFNSIGAVLFVTLCFASTLFF